MGSPKDLHDQCVSALMDGEPPAAWDLGGAVRKGLQVTTDARYTLQQHENLDIAPANLLDCAALPKATVPSSKEWPMLKYHVSRTGNASSPTAFQSTSVNLFGLFEVLGSFCGALGRVEWKRMWASRGLSGAGRRLL